MMNFTNARRLAVAGVLLPGAIVLGSTVAGAQATDEPTTDDPAVESEEREGRKHRGGFRSLFESLDLEKDEIREALESGSTIAELAAAQGIDLDAVIDQMVADAEAKVAENPDGRFAQNFDADEFRARIDAAVNGEFEFRERGEGRRGHAGHKGGGLGDIFEALELDRDTLRAAMESGQSLADIAEAQGVDLDPIIDEIIAEAEAKVAENPDSRFAENFDADELRERIESAVDGELEFGKRGRGGMRGAPEQVTTDA